MDTPSIRTPRLELRSMSEGRPVTTSRVSCTSMANDCAPIR
jgi:hypothetical protein